MWCDFLGARAHHGAMMPYERFEAWRRCHQLVLETYAATKRFPQSELYGLTAQARRAAFSAAVNIVEGSAKRGPREFRRFLDMSIGSLAELSYIFRLSRDLGFLTGEQATSLHETRELAAIVTWKLYESITRRSSTRHSTTDDPPDPP
jgi:four helix bundle protein